jgi:hypothetical protein
LCREAKKSADNDENTEADNEEATEEDFFCDET